MLGLSCRCLECDRQFFSEKDEDICPYCKAWEQAGMEVAAQMAVVRLEERPWSTSWKQERLGVNGRTDD